MKASTQADLHLGLSSLKSSLALKTWTFRPPNDYAYHNGSPYVKTGKRKHPSSLKRADSPRCKRPALLSSSSSSVVEMTEEKDDFLSLSLDCFPLEPPLSPELIYAPLLPLSHESEEPLDLADRVLSLVATDALQSIREDDFDISEAEEGHGKFGKIFRASMKKDGRVFAIKRVTPSTEEEIRHFDHEVEMCEEVRRLGSHPFILEFHGHFYSEYTSSLVFPLMSSLTVFNILPRLTMESSLQDYSTIRFYLSQLVLAVSFLHNRNVYHRDIKPENMLLHPITGSLVLGDFGSCIIVPPSTDHISDCQLNGTPEYTAPELVHSAWIESVAPGSVLKFIDARKEKGRLVAPDWWGVGLVAYEMCLAALPYTRDSNDPENVELYFAISSFDSVPFPKTFSALPQDVQQLLKRFLEKEWKKRLGCGEKKEDEVMEMSFFRGVDWKAMLLGSTHPWGGAEGFCRVLKEAEEWEDQEDE